MELFTNLDLDTLLHWMANYGSIVLFFLLALGIIALPVPDETLMVFAGILMSQEKLEIPQTLIAAYLGSICGITGSYFLGHFAGKYLIHRHGKWFGITQERYEKAHIWFERFGTWTLLIGYFIPGVRHFTGFSAGMAALRYREFALFAYTGALLWVSVFLSIGYFFGHYWLVILEKIEVRLEDALLVVVFALIAYAVYRLRKR